VVVAAVAVVEVVDNKNIPIQVWYDRMNYNQINV
jgi:hypothetical protein